MISAYLDDVVPRHKSPEDTVWHLAKLAEWWGGKPLAAITRSNTRRFVEWRGKLPSARLELEYLRAAATYFCTGVGLAPPKIELPPKSPGRKRWLTREEFDAMLAAARAHENTLHLERFLLIGALTGTRKDAILKLGWIPSTIGGWFDIEAGLLYRRGTDERETSKRRPPVPIPDALQPHLERWRMDGLRYVVHYQGRRIGSIDTGWRVIRSRAGLGRDVIPHTLRHTCATWLMQAGVPIWEAAGYLGMSERMIRDTYGHHHPKHLRGAAEAIGGKRQC